MITDQQFNDWAQSSTKSPVLLVEITHKDGTVYLSDRFYSTGAGETPEHISYDVCLKESVIVERTLDQDSLGAIRVFNDGSLDHWLDYLWDGYTIEIFIGDQSWAREDFKRQYKSTVESFSQLSATSYEFISKLSVPIVQSQMYNVNNVFIAGNHTYSRPIYIGNDGTAKRYRIARDDQFNKEDVTVYFFGTDNARDITWEDVGNGNSNFYLTNEPTTPNDIAFSCSATMQKLKPLFATLCNEFGQAFNADNLAAYPADPDVTFYLNSNMTFPEFLTLTLDTLGALLWINDEGEIEFYRKEIPGEVSINTVTSWITPNDNPTIQTITKEDPVSAVVPMSPDYNHLLGGGVISDGTAFNDIDLTYPYRVIAVHSYAEDSYAIAEARRLADLLSVTRRTYSVSIDRISPEIHIGAIVNIYSPKDRWNNGTEGLNALVVGFTQSYKSNKSELIVWR